MLAKVGPLSKPNARIFCSLCRCMTGDTDLAYWAFHWSTGVVPMVTDAWPKASLMVTR